MAEVLGNTPTAPTGRGRTGSALGYTFAVLTAACWGASPIFIAKGLEGLDSPLWGVAIGLAASVTVYSLVLARDAIRGKDAMRKAAADRHLVHEGVRFEVLAGLFSSFGTVARAVALALAPVVVVIPLSQTATLFTVALAPVFLGRHVERTTPALVVGALLILAGATLVIVGRAT